MRLSPNVPKPVNMKTVPGLPAIDEATVKRGSSFLVSSSSSIGKAEIADEMKIMDYKNIPSMHSLESVPPAKCAAMLNGRNLAPSFNCDASSGHKFVLVEYPEKLGRRKKRELEEPPYSLAGATKRAKVNGGTPIQDSDQLIQVFVHICGTCLSMQVNKETSSIRKLMKRAMRRIGIRWLDGFVLYCGKVLDETYHLSLQGIPRDASFLIIPRLRAGVGHFLNVKRSYSEFTEGMKFFYKVVIPHKLRKTGTIGDPPVMIFLSQAARYMVHRMFICLCRLHDEELSLAGRFEVEDFFFLHDYALLNEHVATKTATTARCILDFRKLSKIIESLFFRTDTFPTTDNLPGYVGDLVKQLRVFVNVDTDKSVLRACISNHCALVSFRVRVRKILEMERFYYFLDSRVRYTFKAVVGDCGNWHIAITDIPILNETYLHNSVAGRSRFKSGATDWLEYVRNFFSHPDEEARGSKRSATGDLGFNEEEADAALALYFEAMLAEFLWKVARDFECPEGVDKKLLLGNEMADPDARGGQSSGTDFQQPQDQI